MGQLEESLAGPWSSTWKDSITVRTEGTPRKWIKIKSCTELKKIDVMAADTRRPEDWGALRGRAEWCRVLETIKRFKPAKRSFLADVLAAKNPAQFIPASVSDEINGQADEAVDSASARNTDHASIAWTKSDPKLKLADDQTKDMIRLESSDYLANIAYYATGDFNGDGIEDVLLEVSIRAFDASQGEGAFFIMTRTKPDGLLKVIEKLKRP
jgi:hypothetical protein